MQRFWKTLDQVHRNFKPEAPAAVGIRVWKFR